MFLTFTLESQGNCGSCRFLKSQDFSEPLCMVQFSTGRILFWEIFLWVNASMDWVETHSP